MISSEMKVPKISLGTWLMGGTKEPDPQNDDQKDISVIHTAIEKALQPLIPHKTMRLGNAMK